MRIQRYVPPFTPEPTPIDLLAADVAAGRLELEAAMLRAHEADPVEGKLMLAFLVNDERAWGYV